MDIKHRTDVKQKTIIESSISLFLKYTVNKTSMDEIAAAAHASKVTVYKYFGDRNGLYAYVYSHIEASYNSDISDQVLCAAPVIQKMTNFIDIYTAFISRGYIGLCEQLSGLSGGVRERFEVFQAKNKKLIIKLVAEAKEQGLIRSGIDDDVIFHFINMGLVYFRHDERYRLRMQSDMSFRQAQMELMFKSIFIDHSVLV